MNNKRFYFVMIGLTCSLAIAIIGATFGANLVLKQQSKKLLDLKTASQVLSRKQEGLATAKIDVAKYSELDREAKAIVPQDKDQAEAVREIVKIADAVNKENPKSPELLISSILFPASTLGNTTVKAPSTTEGSSSSGSAAPVSKTPTISQTQAVPGLKGVYNMPITVQVSGAPAPYSSFISFLDKLEQNRRTAQVSSISITPVATDPGKVNFILTVNAYIKP